MSTATHARNVLLIATLVCGARASAATANVTVSASDQQLRVRTTGPSDNLVAIRPNGLEYDVINGTTHDGNSTMRAGEGCELVTDDTATCAQIILSVLFTGGRTNDYLDVSELPISLTANMGGGANLVVGGTGLNALAGGPGPDTLLSSGTHARLDGAAGNDLLVGGTGGDTLLGRAGDDVLEAGSGADNVLVAGTGDNRVEALPGDIVVKSAGPDPPPPAIRTARECIRLAYAPPPVPRACTSQDLDRASARVDAPGRAKAVVTLLAGHGKPKLRRVCIRTYLNDPKHPLQTYNAKSYLGIAYPVTSPAPAWISLHARAKPGPCPK